jgi:hypothetical protein
MRSLLQNVVAYDFEAKVGLRIGSVRQTITATYNMTQDQPTELNLSAAATQTVVLPSILGTSFAGVAQDRRLHIIANVGSGGNLQVNAHADDGSSAVVTLAPGQAAIVISDQADDKWIVIVGSATGAQAASLTAVTTTQPTLTAFGFTTTAQFNALVNDVNSIIAALKTAGLMASP